MALAAIQASYDEDDDVETRKGQTATQVHEDETNDRVAVITDPTFSVMSKIKLNLTPTVFTRVS